MKKTIAIAAAALTLLASGCGSVETEETKAAPKAAANDTVSSENDGDSSSKAESSRVESSAAAPAEEDSSSESEDGGDDGYRLEKVTNTEGYKGEYINDGNCVILNSFGQPEVDKDMLYHAAELAIKQYNCIAKRDKQGFFDTIGFDRILSGENAVKYWASEYTEEEFDVQPEEIYYPTILYCHKLLGDELGDALEKFMYSKAPDRTRIPDDEIIAELDRLLKKAAENRSADNADFIFDGEDMSCFNKLCHKYKSIDDSEFFSQPEKFVLTPSEDSEYIIRYSVAQSRRLDEGVYIDIDVIVLDGDYAYHFDECSIWLEGDKSSVMPFSTAVTENRWKGLTVKEAGEKIYDEYFSEEAKNAAQLYSDVWEIIIPDAGYDSDFPAPEPPTWDELLASGNFALAASEKGLDLSKDTPEADGDKSLKEYSSVEEGTVYIIHDPDEDGLFYIRYVSPDGKIGEYHGEDNHWF